MPVSLVDHILALHFRSVFDLPAPPERPVVAVDWARPGKGFVTATSDTECVSYLAGWSDYLKTQPPCILPIEKTAGSYPRGSRDECIDIGAERGFEIRTINPKIVASWRQALGLEKTNEQDAMLIWALFRVFPHYFLPISSFTDPKKEARKEALNLARAEATADIVAAREGGWENAEADGYLEHLGSLVCLPQAKSNKTGVVVPGWFDAEEHLLEDVLWEWRGRASKNCSKTRFWLRKQAIPVVVFALKALEPAWGRKTKRFRDLLALHQEGFENIMRSQAHFHALPAFMKTQALRPGNENLVCVAAHVDRQIEVHKARKEWREKGKEGQPPPLLPDIPEQYFLRQEGKKAIVKGYRSIFQIVRDRLRLPVDLEAAAQ